jgi:hypothetical protein
LRRSAKKTVLDAENLLRFTWHAKGRAKSGGIAVSDAEKPPDFRTSTPVLTWARERRSIFDQKIVFVGF